MTPVFTGSINGSARLVLDAPRAFQQEKRALLNQPVELILRRRRSQRSVPQNSFYWGVIIQLTAEFTGYTPEEMHEAWKLQMLKVENPDRPFPTVRSTTDLSTKEFEDYLERIRIFAVSEWGLVLPLPNEVEA